MNGIYFWLGVICGIAACTVILVVVTVVMLPGRKK